MRMPLPSENREPPLSYLRRVPFLPWSPVAKFVPNLDVDTDICPPRGGRTVLDMTHETSSARSGCAGQVLKGVMRILRGVTLVSF